MNSRRKNWVLTQEAFDQLLARLDPNRDSAGAKYETLRQKLIKFFAWRGCATAEDYVDEAINRVSRRIAEGEQIRDLGNYLGGVARILLKEYQKERAGQLEVVGHFPPPGEDDPGGQARFECFERCLSQLSGENRELILQYYQGEKHSKIENRKALADQRQIPAYALRKRAHRIRAKLEDCVRDCMKGSIN